MCEELSACAVMTDGTGSLFQAEVIKTQIMSAGEGRECGGAETEKRELDQIRQMIRAISQSGSISRRWKVLFPPSAVWSEGSARGQEYDLWPCASEVWDTSQSVTDSWSSQFTHVIIYWTWLVSNCSDFEWKYFNTKKWHGCDWQVKHNKIKIK